jgi:hypothetical protein
MRPTAAPQGLEPVQRVVARADVGDELLTARNAGEKAASGRPPFGLTVVAHGQSTGDRLQAPMSNAHADASCDGGPQGQGRIRHQGSRIP